MPKDDTVIVRFPPSPTGFFHVGSARTALFNFLFAQRYGGKLMMRFEDTDKERSKKEFEDDIVEGLSWLGITYDACFKQSERTVLYTGALQKLIDADRAYVSREPAKSGEGEVEIVRLRNPGKSITFTDLVRGDITFDTTDLGDFVIARSMTDPLYHLAVVVDDADMGITHVIRGEDHISNTPRQILIQEALGLARPAYAHIPLILAPDKSKMSKRHGTVSLSEYKKEGFLPEACINFLALLGWNPGTDKELFSLDELIAQFDLSHIQKGGAVFNIDKLRWFNKEYIKKLPQEMLIAEVKKYLPEIEHIVQKDLLLELITEKISIVSDIQELVHEGELAFIVNSDRAIDTDRLPWKDESLADAQKHLRVVQGMLASLKDFPSVDEVKVILWEYASTEGKGSVLWPLRYALTAQDKSPDPFTVIALLGIQESSERIQKVL